jgi:uncharacterized protein (DUF4415 family)
MKNRYDFRMACRGAVVPAAPTKSRIAVRLNKDILAWFRKQVNAVGGGSYQALTNDALRESIKRDAVPLEDTLRRVIREEMQSAG